MTEAVEPLTGSREPPVVYSGKHRVRFADVKAENVIVSLNGNGRVRLTSTGTEINKGHEPQSSVEINLSSWKQECELYLPSVPRTSLRIEKDGHVQYSVKKIAKESFSNGLSMIEQSKLPLGNPNLVSTTMAKTNTKTSVDTNDASPSSEKHIHKGASKHRRNNSDYIEVSGKSSDEESLFSDGEEFPYDSAGTFSESVKPVVIKTNNNNYRNNTGDKKQNPASMVGPSCSNRIVCDSVNNRSQPGSKSLISDNELTTYDSERASRPCSIQGETLQPVSHKAPVSCENLYTSSFTPLSLDSSCRFGEDVVDSRSSIERFNNDNSNNNVDNAPHLRSTYQGQGHHSSSNVSLEINNMNQLSKETEVNKIINCLPDEPGEKVASELSHTGTFDKTDFVQGSNTESVMGRSGIENKINNSTKACDNNKHMLTEPSGKSSLDSKTEKCDQVKCDKTVTACMKEAIRNSFTFLLDMVDIQDLCDNLYERSIIDLTFYETLFEIVTQGKGRNASRRLLIYLSHRHVNKAKMIDALYGSAQFQLIPFFFPEERI